MSVDLEVEITKAAYVDVRVYGVYLNGESLEFSAEVDEDNDINIEINDSTENILNCLDVDEVREWLAGQEN